MPAPDDMVLVAVITGAHGIKGEVKLKSFAAAPAAVAGYGPLVTAAGAPVEIAGLKMRKDGFIARIKGVADRNRAESLAGQELFVPRGRLAPTGADEPYVHDLIGLAVRLKDGSPFGEVAGVPNYGAGDLLEVKVENRRDTVLIPFADAFVPEVDVAKGFITVDLPEGYLDEE